jgi:hypothetical protein
VVAGVLADRVVAPGLRRPLRGRRFDGCAHGGLPRFRRRRGSSRAGRGAGEDIEIVVGHRDLLRLEAASLPAGFRELKC